MTHIDTLLKRVATESWHRTNRYTVTSRSGIMAMTDGLPGVPVSHDLAAERGERAQMISAIPELLAAAQKIMSACIEIDSQIATREDDYIYDTLGGEMSGAFFAARAAIAKASGAK